MRHPRVLPESGSTFIARAFIILRVRSRNTFISWNPEELSRKLSVLVIFRMYKRCSKLSITAHTFEMFKLSAALVLFSVALSQLSVKAVPAALGGTSTSSSVVPSSTVVLASDDPNEVLWSPEITDITPAPIRGSTGGTILGPQNVAIDRQNPDTLASPSTDAGTVYDNVQLRHISDSLMRSSQPRRQLSDEFKSSVSQHRRLD
jgi:hypothetical protein